MSDAPDTVQMKWDERYRLADTPASAMAVLTENLHLLPSSGTALDLACGLGGNALLLARRGLDTTALDISPVAVARLREHAGALPITVRARDVVSEPPEPGCFDVVCVGHFLDRSLCPALAATLRPGGLLFYQTFSRERVDDSGPGDGPFRLQPNELLQLFSQLRVRFYREEGVIGDTCQGTRNIAQLVAQRID